MTESNSLPRSPELLRSDDSVLLLVDAQGKLTDLMPDPNRLLFNIRRMLEAARVLGVPIIATEQYPEKLGPTHESLVDLLAETPLSKRDFSCGECGQLFEPLAAQGIHKIVVVGIETHVCVLQTTLDLLAAGFSVYLVADALSARFEFDHHTALRRMESSGATVTTTEATLFEWCVTSTVEGFKEISQIVRRPLP